MPLIKNESGEAVGAECVNKCGTLSRLDQKIALQAPDGGEPPGVTVLVCPQCHYMELYYGSM